MTLLVFVGNCLKQEIRDNTVGDILGKNLPPVLANKRMFPIMRQWKALHAVQIMDGVLCLLALLVMHFQNTLR